MQVIGRRTEAAATIAAVMEVARRAGWSDFMMNGEQSASLVTLAAVAAVFFAARRLARMEQGIDEAKWAAEGAQTRHLNTFGPPCLPGGDYPNPPLNADPAPPGPGRFDLSSIDELIEAINRRDPDPDPDPDPDQEGRVDDRGDLDPR